MYYIIALCIMYTLHYASDFISIHAPYLKIPYCILYTKSLKEEKKRKNICIIKKRILY